MARPGTRRRRYNPQSQRTIFAPSRSNKRSREDIAEIDAEITQRGNRLGGGYRPIQDEEERERSGSTGRRRTTSRTKYGRHRRRQRDNAGRPSAIRRPQQVSHRRQRSRLIEINHIVGRLTENKKMTEENTKKAEINFMLDLKTLISKTAIDLEMTRVRFSIKREDGETAPEGYRPVFDKLSIRWGLVFVDDQIAVPIDLRRKFKFYISVTPVQP